MASRVYTDLQERKRRTIGTIHFPERREDVIGHRRQRFKKKTKKNGENLINKENTSIDMYDTDACVCVQFFSWQYLNTRLPSNRDEQTMIKSGNISLSSERSS